MTEPTSALRVSRRSFLAAGAVTAAAAIASSGVVSASERVCCPTRLPAMRGAPIAVPLSALTAGNQQAISLARGSATIMDANDAAMALADALADPTIRARTLDVLRNPAPLYQLRSPSRADKEAVRQELLAAGLITDQVTVEGIFPPVGDPHEAPQAFWSAPGSAYAGHHSYPGGLVEHSHANASVAQQWVDTYDARYGLVSESGAIDRSIAIAAPLWHDINKVTVFQWNDDGSELVEQTIADTGGHHPLSGAEAIARGMSPDFVIALLGAHDPPQSGVSLQRLVNYIRAASIIARVDPVKTGLLKPSDDASMPAGLGLSQVPPRVEGHINNLSDHDFIFSGDSATLLIRTLRDLAPEYGIDPDTQGARFNLFRNTVFSQQTDMRLYGVLQTGGAAAVKARIDASVDLSPLLT
jgi:hypothetical protein